MKTKIKNFISRHDIHVSYYELVFPSVGITFTRYNPTLICAGYNYNLHIRLWTKVLTFAFNTFR